MKKGNALLSILLRRSGLQKERGNHCHNEDALSVYVYKLIKMYMINEQVSICMLQSNNYAIRGKNILTNVLHAINDAS